MFPFEFCEIFTNIEHLCWLLLVFIFYYDFFTISKVKTVYKGFNSLRYFGPIIWDLVPTEIKYCDSLENFTTKIRQWKPDSCPCTNYAKISYQM